MNQLRDRIIPVRVSYAEYKNIIANAKKANKISFHLQKQAKTRVCKQRVPLMCEIIILIYYSWHNTCLLA